MYESVFQSFINSTNPSEYQILMKLKSLVLFLASIVMLMSSCTVYVGPNGLPFGAGFQPVVVGTGMSPRGPICGTPIVTGSVVGGLCGPRGPFLHGGIRTHHTFGHGCIPQPAPCVSPWGASWQQPWYHQGSRNIRPGCAGPGGPFGPPVIFH